MSISLSTRLAVILAACTLALQGPPVLASELTTEPFEQVHLDVHTPHIECQSQIIQDGKLRYVKNSGVCETTPGVDQMSGYIDIGTNKSMWFWFFEARNDPETAPFTVCWNNLSNMIFIDEPIGSGFSHGTVDVNSTWAAAPPFWQAFQVLFESSEFSKYQSREFILATESYGGHYGPAFVTYFNEQNDKIRDGTLEGELINVSALMINNGWFDPVIHNQAFVDFATYAPGYGPLQSDDVLEAINDAYYRTGGCKEQLNNCTKAGRGEESNKICYDADVFCRTYVEGPAAGDLYEYDLRQLANSTDIFPPSYYEQFLEDPDILEKIGAESPYVKCASPDVERLFNSTGDDGRTLLPELSKLADSGMKILIWAGDADINCNWLGGEQVALAMDWYGQEKLRSAKFANMTLDGKVVAEYKNAYNFSFARVLESGHEVPSYQPKAALEIFRQVINMEPLHSVP
ncbi:alpha/beta-hydrolase [Daedaleopsis nitida]|nr:alpha/beta-hydrolase [Daedaleopsis nitida]